MAVAAVVPQPLNSFMAIEPTVNTHRRPARQDDRDHRRALRLRDARHRARLGRAQRKDVKVVTVGYNLLPALLAHRVDAVLGVYRNVEGIQLAACAASTRRSSRVDRAGVPFYDELVLVANKTRLHSDPRLRGHRAALRRAPSCSARPTRAATRPARSRSCARRRAATPASSRRRRRRRSRCSPARTASAACARPSGQRFGAWMHERGSGEARR